MRAGWLKVGRTDATCLDSSRQMLILCPEGALDSGAHGIVVPLLYTADDAKKLVKSAKFPPQGQRGFGSPFAMERVGGVTMTEYLQQANDALLTIVQVETKEALENVRAPFCRLRLSDQVLIVV